MKARLTLLIVALLLPTFGCVLTDDFGDDDTDPIVAAIESEIVAEDWYGVLSLSSLNNRVGLLIACSFNANRTGTVRFNANYEGTWSVNDDREVVFIIEDVEPMIGDQNEAYSVGDTIIFFPSVEEDGQRHQLVDMDLSLKEVQPTTPLMPLSRSSEATLTISELGGTWRSNTQAQFVYQEGGEEQRINAFAGIHVQKTQNRVTYGPFVQGSLYPWLEGKFVVFPCDDGECWGMDHATVGSGEKEQKSMGFVGQIDLPDADEIFIPVFTDEEPRIDARRATLHE
jgi:hypothetical protein